MSFQPSSTALPSEAWQPAAVAQLALIILVGAALLNLVERIILAIKVRTSSKLQARFFCLKIAKYLPLIKFKLQFPITVRRRFNNSFSPFPLASLLTSKKKQVPNTFETQADIQYEIADLKRQAKFLNNPDTFAQCAKMERKALALEKHLERLQTQEKLARAHPIIKLPGYIRTLSIVAVFIVSYKVPVAVAVRPDWVWPLGKWLAMGTGKPRIIGFIGIIPWSMICHRATKALFGVRN
jgi:hypothetical protein